MDRRTSRTRRFLKEAMLQLILEKGYDAVTVEEITDRADLGRTTFYLHYKDKEDLLVQSIDEMVDDLIQHITQIPLSAWRLQNEPRPGETASPTPVLLVFQHAVENAALYRVILRGEGAYRASSRLREIINNAVYRVLDIYAVQEKLTLHLEVPQEVFVNYLASSMLGMVTWWLEADMPYPPQEMAEMYQKLLVGGAAKILGIES